MSGGMGNARATAGLPLVERIVTSNGEAFAAMRDNDASFLMVANATSIIQWIVKMPSERILAETIAHALTALPAGGRRRPLPTDRHRSTCTGWDLLTVSGVALSFVVVLSSSRLEGGAGSAVRRVGVAS